MGNRVKATVTAALLGSGLLAHAAPASALTIVDLLRENFNDVTGIPAGGERTVFDILTNNPAQLPAGTIIVGSPNVRGVDNVINTTGGAGGFHDHFTSNFLVLGDDSGTIGPLTGTPTTGNTGISLPFVIPGNAVAIAISYRDAFNGVDNANPQLDEFLVRLDGAGPPQEIEFLESPDDFDGHTGIAAIFGVFDDSNPLTISPGTYALQFRLNESGGQTNTAVGLDRIRVRALVEVPGPATLLLLASGLAGLAGFRCRRPRQRAGC